MSSTHTQNLSQLIIEGNTFPLLKRIDLSSNYHERLTSEPNQKLAGQYQTLLPGSSNKGILNVAVCTDELYAQIINLKMCTIPLWERILWAEKDPHTHMLYWVVEVHERWDPLKTEGITSLKEWRSMGSIPFSQKELLHILIDLYTSLRHTLTLNQQHHHISLENVYVSRTFPQNRARVVVISNADPIYFFTPGIEDWHAIKNLAMQLVLEKLTRHPAIHLFAQQGRYPTTSYAGWLEYFSYLEDTDASPDLKLPLDELVHNVIAILQNTLKTLQKEKIIPFPISVYPAHKNATPLPGTIYIPKGTCLIGGDSVGDDALPIHPVDSNAFYIKTHLVTVGQYAAFVAATGYLTNSEKMGVGAVWREDRWELIPGIHWRNPMDNPLPYNFGEHPVTQLTYEDAQAFCQWRGVRLPTEEEWEYAAKGTVNQTMRFPWGDELSPSQANFSSKGTRCVGEYPPNFFGLYDIIGNVWEWTSSYYQPYPGSYAESSHFGQLYRIVRGGAWNLSAAYCQTAFRNANQPERAYPNLGFRYIQD